PVRPTTSQPLAWIPSNPEPGLVRLLDDLGLEQRLGHDHALPIALIDLPDYDSVEFEHRATVEALIPRVDAVIWVLDPQKYSDRALHRDYLIPLVGYANQFLFVLNQIDRLDESGLAAVRADLGDRLRSEGFESPHIVTTAARPATGPTGGIDELLDAIGARFQAKQTAHAKLLEDIRRAHRELIEVTGVGDQTGSPGRSWEETQRAAVDGLVDLIAGPAMTEQAERVGERLASSRAAGPVGRLGALLRRSRLGKALGASPDEVSAGEWWTQPGLERTLARLSRGITDLSVVLGGELGRRLRAGLSADKLETEVRAAVEGARTQAGELGPPPSRWWWGLVGAIQVGLFAALMAGLVWVWVDGIDRGETPWSLLLVAGSLVLGGLLGLATRSSGRRSGRRNAADYRSHVETLVAEQVEVRIGHEVSEAVLAGEEMMMAIARLEREIIGLTH
ncbi:MAG: hypothetical protein ACR2NL_12110, partial [Acidimicrobiia bacterium]